MSIIGSLSQHPNIQWNLQQASNQDSINLFSLPKSCVFFIFLKKKDQLITVSFSQQES